ncbi:hypothetical protein JCM8547_007718 [Rhodosporidiobolus lusitaniae]
MTSPTITIAPLTPADIPFLPRIYFSSFAPTALLQYNFPNVPEPGFTLWMEYRMNAALDGRAQGNKGDVLVAKLGEQVAGYASYSWFPDAKEREPGKAKRRVLPEGADERRAGDFLAKLDEQKASLRAAHYSLDNLAVAPEAQGKGVGKALTLALLAKAKEERVELTLEATELGRPLYSKMGFKDCGEPLQGDQQPGVDILWPMIYKSA